VTDPYIYTGSYEGANVQYGVLQLGGQLSIGNTINDLSAGVSYTITFACRKNSGLNINVFVDGTIIGNIPEGGDTAWRLYTGVFTAGSTTAALQLDFSVSSGSGYMLDSFTIAPTNSPTCVNP
jgi:hypothetical protein